MLAALQLGARFAATPVRQALHAGLALHLAATACQPHGGPAENGQSTTDGGTPVGTSSHTSGVTSATGSATQGGSGAGSGDGTTTAGPGCMERTHEGHATLGQSQNAAALTGVTVITGDLSIESNEPGRLAALQCLRQIGGSLRLNATVGGPAELGPFALAHLQRLTSIGGDLEVLGQPHLDHLHGLGALEAIGGDLLVADSPGIQTLDGLQGLKHVGGRVRLANLTRLTSLTGLSNLEDVGELDLRHLPRLNSLAPLVRLRHCLKLILLDLPQLATLTGLEGLVSVQRIELRQLAQLIDLGGFRGLETVEKSIEFAELDRLTDLRGLEALTWLGELSIVGLPELTHLIGFPKVQGSSLTRIELAENPKLSTLEASPIWQGFTGHLRLAKNPLLATITGLGPLTQVESLVLAGPDQITDLSPLSQLVEITGLLQLSNHPRLSSLAGLGQLRRIAELELIGPLPIKGLGDLSPTLQVTHATRLIELEGLSDLAWLSRKSHFEGTLELAGLASLPGLDVLAPLRSITGRLALRSLPQLTTIDAWPTLEALGGLTIANNHNLERLTLPPSLTQLGSDGLCIHGNAQLAILDGQGQLGAIAGPLTLTQNPALASLEGLNGLTSVGSALWIEGNDMLTQLSALSRLQSTGARVWTLGETCVGLPRSAAKQRDGYVGIEIRRMAALESLAGLEAVESTMGSLFLKENPRLRNVQALAGLRVVGPSVHILNNPSLTGEAATNLVETLDFDGLDLQTNGNGYRQSPNHARHAPPN